MPDIQVSFHITPAKTAEEARSLIFPLSVALNVAHAQALRAFVLAPDNRDAQQLAARDVEAILRAQASLVSLELYLVNESSSGP